MRTGNSSETTSLTTRYNPLNLRCNISSKDLTKACKSLLGQIDWSRVALDVVEDELPIICRAAVQRGLQTQIEAVLTEACNNGILGRRDSEYLKQVEETDKSEIHTESNEDGSDEESYEGSFVESDESEAGSNKESYEGSFVDSDESEIGSGEESYKGSFVDSDESEAGSAEYQDNDDSVNAEEDEDGVKDRCEICDVCHKSMDTTASL